MKGGFFVGGNLDLVHLLQKKFRDCNIYLCVYIHVHMYLTYIADVRYFEKEWNDCHWLAQKHGDLYCNPAHSQFVFIWRSFESLSSAPSSGECSSFVPQAALFSASHVLPQIDKQPFTWKKTSKPNKKWPSHSF